MARVTFDKIAKSYGDVQVIREFDLEIHDSEFMVLVGPSGCGKSTLLRMLAGLEEVTGGKISIDDRVVNNLAPKDRDIAMVFQNYALYPHMTVRQNLEFGLKIRKTPSQEMEQRVNEAAEILGIRQFLDRRPRQLSGGQRQRVAVGRAIVRKPSVFLFDEPLSNLDAKLRVQMRAEIAKLHQRLKTTTVYVTHDQVEAMTMGSRICVLKDGDLQQVGTPLEVYENPENLFVATFIGTPPMNFLRARLSGDAATLEYDGASLPVPERYRQVTQGGGGREVLVGIRPENFKAAQDNTRGPAAPLHVKVEIVEPLGHEVIVHGRIGETVLVAAVDPHEAPGVGDEARLFVELDAVRMFDAATEQKLKA